MVKDGDYEDEYSDNDNGNIYDWNNNHGNGDDDVIIMLFMLVLKTIMLLLIITIDDDDGSGNDNYIGNGGDDNIINACIPFSSIVPCTVSCAVLKGSQAFAPK